MQCVIVEHNLIHHRILTWMNLAQIDIPIVIVVLLNVKMLHFAFTKNGRSLSKRSKTGILTTGAICSVLVFSNLLREVVEVLKHIVMMDHDHLPPVLWKLATCLYYFNSFCNFFLYIMVNQSFRKFILDILAMKSRRLSHTLSRLPSRSVNKLITRLPGTVNRLRNRYSAVPAAAGVRETENSETGVARI
eukprot:sb/3471165/